jgi:hypothetical protein
MRQGIVGVNLELDRVGQLRCLHLGRLRAGSGLDRRGIRGRFDKGIGLPYAQHDHGAETGAGNRQAIEKAAPRQLDWVTRFRRRLWPSVFGIIAHVIAHSALFAT